MKINTKALLDTGGFSCTSLAFNEETGGYAECEARAVFITEETVAGARAAQADMPPVDPSRLPDLRYGDVLVSRAHPDGRKEGLHIPAGRDAGLVIAVLSADGSSQNIPFTGSHMLAARQRLLAMSARGEALSGDQEKILAGVQGVLEIVAARPDPKRFSGDLIGKAFMCSLIDRPNRIELSISDAEFGRKARADMIRAQIAHLSPDHPDGLSPAAAASLDELLREVGVQTGADAIREVGGISITEETIRGMVAANPQFCTDVFGSITATPVHRLSAAAITSGEYDLLADELSEHVLTGSWVKRAHLRAQEITGAKAKGHHLEMMLVAVDGLDLMAIRETAGKTAGKAFVYAWPSADRLPFTEIGNQTVLNISPEEVPEETEILRLGNILDSMISDRALDGADQQGRAIRMA